MPNRYIPIFTVTYQHLTYIDACMHVGDACQETSRCTGELLEIDKLQQKTRGSDRFTIVVEAHV